MKSENNQNLSIEDKLRRLKLFNDMLEKNLIKPEEFESEKIKILKR